MASSLRNTRSFPPMKTAHLTFAFFLVFTLCSFTSDTFQQVEWTEERKLSWDDFRGEPNPSSHAHAATAIRISAAPYYKNKKLYYSVTTFFDPSQSWCRSKSEQLLRHEQLHFDIAELYARKVRKRISELRSRGVKDVKTINAEIQKLLDESNRVDATYDKKTIHGANPERQRRWEENILYQLRNLASYAKPVWESQNRTGRGR